MQKGLQLKILSSFIIPNHQTLNIGATDSKTPNYISQQNSLQQKFLVNTKTKYRQQSCISKAYLHSSVSLKT